MKSTTSKRPCFIEEDSGLASLAGIEEAAGISGNHHHNHFLSRPLYYSTQRRNSLRNVSNSFIPPSPRSGKFSDFLDACSLCKKPLGSNKDIFMYRGDTPFCSEECRQEQIEIDEAKENNLNFSASMKGPRKKDQNNKSKSTSPNKTNQGYPFRTSPVAAA